MKAIQRKSYRLGLKMLKNLHSSLATEILPRILSIRAQIFVFAYLLRIHHWLKNLLIFIPAFLYSADSSTFYGEILGFLSFSLIASSGYIINDFNDQYTDRSNPVKSMRPIARSSLANRVIVQIGIFTFVMALVSGVFVSSSFLVVIICYFLLSLCYTFYLKRFVYLRMISILTFNIFRLGAGFIIVQIPFSVPFFVLTSLLIIALIWLKTNIDLINYEMPCVIYQLQVKISRAQIFLFLNYCLIVFVVTNEVYSELVRDQILSRPELIFADVSLAIIFFMLIYYFGRYKRTAKEPIILCLQNPLILFIMFLGLASVWMTRN